MTSDSRDTVGAIIDSTLKTRKSRRTFLKTTAVAGAAAAGAGLLKGPLSAYAAETPAQIFSIARTAERLAVTFYTNGVNNAAALGITGNDLVTLKSFLIHEQIHELFFGANGGTPLTSSFSFPKGSMTFTDLNTFISTQQQLEGAFDAAFIAAAEEFAAMGMPTLTRIAAQIAMIESEHRALGRAFAADAKVGDFNPADNWVYAPKLVKTVGDAPAVLTAAGYLSPTTGNTYNYQQVDFTSADLAPVYNLIDYKAPFAATMVPLAASLSETTRYRAGRNFVE